MLLSDKKIIVTGGASGIAAATVRAYAREGARVVALDVQDEAGRRVAGEAGTAVTYHHCDVSRREEVREVFARARSRNSEASTCSPTWRGSSGAPLPRTSPTRS